MREILFRGKQVDNGHWVYGTPVTLKNSETYINFEFCGWIDRTLVYPDTVGQYTGLKDKNDKRIFEGDIVRYGDSIHLVVFEKRAGNAYFGIVMDEQETWGFCPSVPSNKMEVIGNIYDDPELMKTAP